MNRTGLARLFITLLALAVVLSGCETAEQRTARETQFNGQPLDAVIARIGAPQSRTASKAVWNYTDTVTNLMPVYRYDQNGQAILVGHNRRDVTLSCTYTARLGGGRVINSHYVGTNCIRFAPRLTG